MLGPKNKILGENFLKLVIDLINNYLLNSKSITIQEELTVNKDNWSIRKNSNVMYKTFIDTEPKVIYNNEEFYIRDIQILDQYFDICPTKNTYKDIFNTYNSNPLPSDCSCEYEDDYEENNYIQQQINILPLKSIKEVKFNGEYCSYPDNYNNKWSMVFQYKENNFNLTLNLGPKRYIKYKAITGHGNSFNNLTVKNPNYRTLQPIYTIDDNKLVYNYMPSDLFFEEDFIQIIKNSLLSNNNIIKYKNIEYKIIDSIFYKHEEIMFSCGCSYSNSAVLTLQEGLKIMPNHFSYANEFSYSLTPEWYLQVQFGSFESRTGMSAKFILNYVTSLDTFS